MGRPSQLLSASTAQVLCRKICIICRKCVDHPGITLDFFRLPLAWNVSMTSYRDTSCYLWDGLIIFPLALVPSPK
jgi:hypothetical protein